MPKCCSVGAAGRRRSRLVIEESSVHAGLASHHLSERSQVTIPTLQGREREPAQTGQQTGLASTYTEKESEMGAANHRPRGTLPLPLASPLESDMLRTVTGLLFCPSIRLVTCTLCGSSQSVHVSTSFLINYGSCRGHRSGCSRQCSEWFLFYTFRFARLAEL
ncbi:hypothetical protein EV401DRAFT_2039053 [Pisolithus croceorrhizus]|nr:hypothetical protein EV401DRAFT_2039053 [Pisolithus croceorrhizus]